MILTMMLCTTAQAGLFDDLRMDPERFPTYSWLMHACPSDSYLNEENDCWIEEYEHVSEAQFLQYGEYLEEQGWRLINSYTSTDYAYAELTDGDRRFEVGYRRDLSVLFAAYKASQYEVVQSLLNSCEQTEPCEPWVFSGGIELTTGNVMVDESHTWQKEFNEKAYMLSGDCLRVEAELTNTKEDSVWLLESCVIELHLFYDGVHETIRPVTANYLLPEGEDSIWNKGTIKSGESVTCVYYFPVDKGLISAPNVRVALKAGNPISEEFCAVLLR